MKKLRRNRKKGFTLIELIVVIAILGILAAILIPQFTGLQERAKENAILAEARSVATAVDAYYALESKWPDDPSQIEDLIEIPDLAEVLVFGDGGFTYWRNGYLAVRYETRTEITVSKAAAAPDVPPEPPTPPAGGQDEGQ